MDRSVIKIIDLLFLLVCIYCTMSPLEIVSALAISLLNKGHDYWYFVFSCYSYFLLVISNVNGFLPMPITSWILRSMDIDGYSWWILMDIDGYSWWILIDVIVVLQRSWHPLLSSLPHLSGRCCWAERFLSRGSRARCECWVIYVALCNRTS